MMDYLTVNIKFFSEYLQNENLHVIYIKTG